MSLLVINSSSRVARGLIKGFTKSGHFSQILCADLLPNYKAIERFISLKEELGGEKKLIDLKITGKESLKDAIDRADQIVYVTHDYYQNVPSKTSMFDNVMQFIDQEFSDRKVE